MRFAPILLDLPGAVLMFTFGVMFSNLTSHFVTSPMHLLGPVFLGIALGLVGGGMAIWRRKFAAALIVVPGIIWAVFAFYAFMNPVRPDISITATLWRATLLLGPSLFFFAAAMIAMRVAKRGP